MSNAQLEERQEHEQAAAVALALCISVADLDELDWTIDAHASDDGVIYGYNIHFARGSNPEILGRIRGLIDGSWVRVGPEIGA